MSFAKILHYKQYGEKMHVSFQWSFLSFCPSVMLSSVTTCFNSSAHEFGGAGSSLATRPSKIESILILCSNIYSKKLFWGRKSSSLLYMPSIMTAQTEKWGVGKHSYTFTEKIANKNKTKYQTTEHINKKQRNTMLSPLWTHQNIKVQKSLALVTEEFTTTFDSPVRNAHIRLLLLYIIWSDEGVTIISRCLAPWRKDHYIKIPHE